MHNTPGFGFLRIMLSIAMMLNMSFLIGLTQKDSTNEILHKVKEIQKAKVEIAYYQQEIERSTKAMREAEQIQFAELKN